MNTAGHRIPLALALGVALTWSAVALAAPMSGKTYKGSVPSTGIRTERHRTVKLHAGGSITLKVSGNGRSVTVHFTSAAPVLYCNATKSLQVQSTKPASISRSGTFKASIAERFSPGPGLPPIVQVITGRFSGHTVSGKIQTNAAQCSGVASFSAHA